MALASTDDINQFLPATTLQITDVEDDPWQSDADHIVRGYLSNVFSAATLSAWTTPNTTPDLIRSIAGRLIASKFYASKVAGEMTSYPEYAQNLYNEAIALLEGIQSGAITVEGVDEIVTTGDHLTSADFWPNDISDPLPMFTIDQVFS